MWFLLPQGSCLEYNMIGYKYIYDQIIIFQAIPAGIWRRKWVFEILKPSEVTKIFIKIRMWHTGSQQHMKQRKRGKNTKSDWSEPFASVGEAAVGGNGWWLCAGHGDGNGTSQSPKLLCLCGCGHTSVSVSNLNCTVLCPAGSSALGGDTAATCHIPAWGDTWLLSEWPSPGSPCESSQSHPPWVWFLICQHNSAWRLQGNGGLQENPVFSRNHAKLFFLNCCYDCIELLLMTFKYGAKLELMASH